MNVIFRVDSSTAIGTGHLMRCRTLAEELGRRGHGLRFVCRAHPGHLSAMLQAEAIPVTLLPQPSTPPADAADSYGAWLGVSQATDAADTIGALNGQRPDWLIVDHYGLDAAWERALRPHVGRIMAIDDLANRQHECALLLDQNHTRDQDSRYHGLTPPDCGVLPGPRYGLLRPEYRAYRETSRPRDGRIQRILVFFGGADATNMTGRAMEALSAPEFAHLAIDVVVGAANPHRAGIEAQVARRPHTTLYTARPHLADLMAQADLALGAGGATSWERLCLGLPTLVVSVADNQIPACSALHEDGLVEYLGPCLAVGPDTLGTALSRLLKAPARLAEMSVRGQTLVDGMGTLRIVEALNPTPVDQLSLRPAQPDDALLYFSWSNDPEVRRQACEPIGWEAHRTRFHDTIADPHRRLFVLMAGPLPVGQIRYHIQGDEAVIDCSLDALVRGRGWALHLVHLCIPMLRDAGLRSIRAAAKVANPASRAVLLRLGFQEQSSRTAHGGQVFRLRL